MKSKDKFNIEIRKKKLCERISDYIINNKYKLLIYLFLSGAVGLTVDKFIFLIFSSKYLNY
jgi:hypothetical protein